MNFQSTSNSDNTPEPNVFDTEKSYLIAQNFFDPSDISFVYEIQVNTAEYVMDYANLDLLIGKDFAINLCTFAGRIPSNQNEDEYDLVYRKRGARYGFEILKTTEFFPLIEGEVEPGIYRNVNGDKFYQIDSLSDLSKLYSCTVEIGLDYDEYKIACKVDVVEIIECINGNETVLHTIPRHPFSFFSLNCPICSGELMGYVPLKNSKLCRLTNLRCHHFVERIEKENGEYIRESLDSLNLEYKLVNEDLFLLASTGWEKPVIYIPPFDSRESYWSKCDGYQDIFVFLKKGNLIGKKANLLGYSSRFKPVEDKNTS